MAYCPHCKKTVDDRWIECPVCRTEVIASKTAVRKEKARTLNKVPDADGKKPMGFLERLAGVLRFRADAFDSMSIKPQFGELTLLFAADFAILYAANSIGLYIELPAGSLGGRLLTSQLLIGVGISIAMVFYMITGAIAHLIIKVLGGHAEYVVTLFVMLYVSLAWGIPATLASLGLLAFGLPTLLVAALWLFVALSVIAGFIVGLSVVHGASRTATAIGVISSYAALVALYYYITTGPDIISLLAGLRQT
ncbi:MAG: hypothetical protein PHG85_04395 [Candidatus Altiarchaeota archaeon]|nr:hypothetical protein [Candidatus Altiarchaeota archaeon]